MNNPNILNYFLTRSLFLGGGISLIFVTSGTDAYIAILLGILLGIGLLYIINKLITIKEPFSLFLKNNKIFKILYFIYLIFIIFILLIILSNFIYSFFLPFTPSIMSLLPFIFIASFLNSKKIENIIYVAIPLLIISLCFIFTKTILTSGDFDITNILPIMTTNPKSIIKAAIMYAILSVTPYFTLIGENIDFKKSLKYYLISNMATYLVILSIILTMGNLITVYSYPEYSILRKISIFNFIENIENFISASWFFDIFICLSITSLKIKEVLNTKKSIIPFAIVLSIALFIYKVFSDNYYNTSYIKNKFIYIFGGLIIILTILLAIIKYIKKQHQDKLNS